MRITAAALSVLLGIGFGLPCLPGAIQLRRTGEVWTLLGFPTYGGGAFERLGIRTTTRLLAAFFLLCLTEVAVGIMIWSEAPGATVLAVGILPVEVLFWAGFTLPFGPPLGITRTVLVLLL